MGKACPLSGRNSTYRPVQISGTGSEFITPWLEGPKYKLHDYIVVFGGTLLVGYMVPQTEVEGDKLVRMGFYLIIVVIGRWFLNGVRRVRQEKVTNLEEDQIVD